MEFQYVFSSDEYNEYVNSRFNDVFAFFVNGVNCATLPGTAQPVSVNTINGGNPFGTAATNPSLYRNNDPNDPGPPTINTEMDGLTVVLTCRDEVSAGVTNHMKLAIADASDARLDSNVFLRAQSLISGTLITTSLSGGGQAGPHITVPSGPRLWLGDADGGHQRHGGLHGHVQGVLRQRVHEPAGRCGKEDGDQRHCPRFRPCELQRAGHLLLAGGIQRGCAEQPCDQPLRQRKRHGRPDHDDDFDHHHHHDHDDDSAHHHHDHDDDDSTHHHHDDEADDNDDDRPHSDHHDTASHYDHDEGRPCDHYDNGASAACWVTAPIAPATASTPGGSASGADGGAPGTALSVADRRAPGSTPSRRPRLEQGPPRRAQSNRSR